MPKSYDSQNKTSFTPPRKLGGKCQHINLLARVMCFMAFLLTAFDSVALQNDDSTNYGQPSMADSTAVHDRGQVSMADSTAVHFRKSSSGLDFSWDTNEAKLERLKQKIHEMFATDPSLIISSLKIVGSASPEGSEKYNRLLSEKRATAVYDYLTEFISLPDSITKFEYLGRNWKGLYDLVSSDPSVPSHPEVLSLLRKALTNSGLSASESNRLLFQLKKLKGGEPYIYLYRHLFPALRTSYVYVEYEKQSNLGSDSNVLEEIDSIGSQHVDTLVTKSEETDSATYLPADIYSTISPSPYTEATSSLQADTDVKSPFYMDLRTNMLYDIAAVPNIGAEFYVGKNISVYGNWMYGWWDNDSRHRYWRIYGGELGGRWWFGNQAHDKPLTGHHIGIYGGLLTFDFEWGGTGYMGGLPGGTLWDRALVNAGIEYGYSLPISRRLNIDFSLGLGYLGGNYIKYFPFDNDYYRQKEYKMRFFGPTKLEVSLVWLIGRGNFNAGKGGDAR